MSAIEQLNMFEIKNDPIWNELKSLEFKQDNLRRGVFQRVSALMKLVESLQNELIEVRQVIRQDNDFKPLQGK
jgi:hypothetical protein